MQSNIKDFINHEVGNKANVNNMAYIGSKPSSVVGRDSDSWYTPEKYTTMARKVMSSIDLDPFSSKEANEKIKAAVYYSIENSAFDNTWKFDNPINIWMNPPYGRGLIEESIEEFIRNYELGFVKQAVILVNNSTETIWFHKLLEYNPVICIVRKRISFETIDNKQISNNTRGQVFFYFGNKRKIFKNEFNKIGKCFTLFT